MILHGGGQRTICKSQASLPTTWVLGIRFRLWGFSKHLLFWVILPDLLQILKKCMLCNILKIRKKSLESWKKSYAIPKICHLHLRLQPQGVLKHSFLQKVIPEASSGRTQGSHFIPDPCLTGLCNRLTVLTEVLVRPIWTLPHSITSQGDVNAAATVTEEMVAGAHTGAPCWWTSLRSQHCWESQHAPSVSMTRKRELKAGWRDRDNEEATQSWRNRLAAPPSPTTCELWGLPQSVLSESRSPSLWFPGSFALRSFCIRSLIYPSQDLFLRRVTRRHPSPLCTMHQ